MKTAGFVNEPAIIEIKEIRILLAQALRRFGYSIDGAKALIQEALSKVDALQTKSDSMKETMFEVSATCSCCQFKNVVRCQISNGAMKSNDLFAREEALFRKMLVDSGWKQQANGKWICPSCLIPGVKAAREKGTYLFGNSYSKQRSKPKHYLVAV